MTTIERIEALEAQNRSLRTWAGTTSLGLLVMVVMFAIGLARKEPAGPLEATELRVVDKDGRIRAVVGCNDSGPFIRLKDAGGAPTFDISAEAGTCRLAFFDSKARDAAVVGCGKEGGYVFIQNRETGGGVALDMSHADAHLSFADAKGKNRLLMGMEKGDPVMSFVDEQQKSRLELSQDAQSTTIRMFDPAMHSRVSIEATSTESSVVLGDQHGRVRANVTVDKKGPSLSLLDHAERPLAHLECSDQAAQFLLSAPKPDQGSAVLNLGSTARILVSDANGKQLWETPTR